MRAHVACGYPDQRYFLGTQVILWAITQHAYPWHRAGTDRAVKWQQAAVAGQQAAEASAEAQRKVRRADGPVTVQEIPQHTLQYSRPGSRAVALAPAHVSQARVPRLQAAKAVHLVAIARQLARREGCGVQATQRPPQRLAARRAAPIVERSDEPSHGGSELGDDDSDGEFSDPEPQSRSASPRRTGSSMQVCLPVYISAFLEPP